MRSSLRIESAVIKLYTAFYNQTLNPESCTQCAVGNICNQTDAWANFTDKHGSIQLNYVGLVHERLGRKHYGYTPSELLQIEACFLKACGYQLPLYSGNGKSVTLTDEVLFNALAKTIALLCQLDQVPNMLAFTKTIREQLRNTTQKPTFV